LQVNIHNQSIKILLFSRPRLRSNPTAASLALRASENSPLTRSNKLGGPTSGGRSLLIEQQKQQDVSYYQ
jgi:hypothetical protein